MRALKGLKQAGALAQLSDAMGRPPEMPLKKIHFDQNNSRRPEDENTPEGIEEQRELTQDIKKRGVKSPVSLRPHPTKEDEYMVNFGHRRVKAAVDAGLTTIPYFLDVSFDSYDQVKENLLHRRPSVWALAEFVRRKLDEKQSKADIAEGLGKTNQNLVTELLALVDAPSCVHQAYVLGVKSTRTLYDLRRAYDEFPEQIGPWCTSGTKITRTTIQEKLIDLRISAEALSAPCGIDATSVIGHQKERSQRLIETSSPIRSTNALTLCPDQPVPAATQLEQSSMEATNRRKKRNESAITSNTAALQYKPHASQSKFTLEYQGKKAQIAPGCTVMIVLEGDTVVREVPISDLLFNFL